MNELSYQDCVPLIKALQEGVRTTGILKAINEFGVSDSNPVNLSARSIGESMVNGKDLQASFRDSFPRFPDIIIRILISSALNGVLDYALDDALLVLKDQRPIQDVFENLHLLAQKYESVSNTQICDECFERSFGKLLARAATENAYEVILEQDGESFFHQKFLSTKLIHMIEPTHSLVYRTFLEKLNSACENGGHFETSNQIFKVTQENPSSFSLTANSEDVLKIVFKTVISNRIEPILRASRLTEEAAHSKIFTERKQMNVIEIPFVEKVGIKRNGKGELELPFSDSVQNHLQNIHASAQFTLAETASGEMLGIEFPELVDKVVPILRDSEIKFRKPAVELITAFPSISQESVKKFYDRFSENGRVLISVDVEVKDIKGEVTCSGTFNWFVQSIETDSR